MNPTDAQTAVLIQQTIAAAPGQGATKAQIDIGPDEVQYCDDAGTTITGKVTPGAARNFGFYENVFHYPPPTGLAVNVTHHEEPPHTLQNVEHGQVAQDFTPSGWYSIHLKTGSLPRNQIVNPDGTLRRTMPSLDLNLLTTPDREPGTPVTYQRVSFVAVPTPDNDLPPDGNQVEEIIETAADLFCRHMEELNRGPGYAWTTYAYPIDDDPKFQHRFPQAPATATPEPPVPQKYRQAPIILMPQNPVSTGPVHATSTSVIHAWTANPPYPSTIVEHEENNAPVIALRGATVTELDGASCHIPGPNQDGTDPDTTPRLDRSRMAKVRNITLHVAVLSHDRQRELAVHDLDASIYADADRHHEVLLVTQEAGLSPKAIDAIADLTSFEQPDLYTVTTSFASYHADVLAGQTDPDTATEEILAMTAREMDRFGFAQTGSGPQSVTHGTVTVSYTPPAIP